MITINTSNKINITPKLNVNKLYLRKNNPPEDDQPIGSKALGNSLYLNPD